MFKNVFLLDCGPWYLIFLRDHGIPLLVGAIRSY